MGFYLHSAPNGKGYAITESPSLESACAYRDHAFSFWAPYLDVREMTGEEVAEMDARNSRNGKIHKDDLQSITDEGLNLAWVLFRASGNSKAHDDLPAPMFVRAALAISADAELRDDLIKALEALTKA